MSLTSFKEKFNQLLHQLKGGPADLSFIKTKEKAYEALVLASVMKEYARVHNGVKQIHPPSSSVILSMAPGKFKLDKAFKIDFNDGNTFHFAVDVEIFGLVAFQSNRPSGTLFEADVIAIHSKFVDDVRGAFRGYPAPQHLHSVFECKHGTYNKGQLRELIGLRRHVSFLHRQHTKFRPDPSRLYAIRIINSEPPVAMILVRPKRHKFLDLPTAALYDLQQLVIN